MFELLRPILPPVPEEIERLVIERAKDPNSDYAKREVLSTKKNGRTGEGVLGDGFSSDEIKDTIPFSKEAQQWEGWNSALKPAFEPIVVARKPLEGTVAANVLKYGTGAINIDGCRVPTEETWTPGATKAKPAAEYDGGWKRVEQQGNSLGRYPANLLHDGSPEVLACFPDGGTSAAPRPVNANRDGEHSSDVRYTEKGNTNFAMKPGIRRPPTSPARFFYCAKASRSERGEGNIHPTVKPLALMRWCVTLVAPKDSVVLDPFMGSGSTGIAALQCGCRFVGIEKEPEYMEIAKQRIATALDEPIQDDYKNEPTETADCPDAGDKSPRTSTIQQGELNL
jgi:site-specific DNA-methyltransferase (adenine-specific)